MISLNRQSGYWLFNYYNLVTLFTYIIKTLDDKYLSVIVKLMIITFHQHLVLLPGEFYHTQKVMDYFTLSQHLNINNTISINIFSIKYKRSHFLHTSLSLHQFIQN